VADAAISEFTPLKSFAIEDRTYELHTRGICSCCGQQMFEVWRWNGAIFSRYILHNNFDTDQFEAYVQDLDREFLECSADLLGGFRHELSKINSENGINDDGSYAFRLAEYGRQRVIALQALKSFDLLLSREKPIDDHGKAVMAAFELGFAAAYHRMMISYEDYVYDGISMEEWRTAGLPKAREERLRQGAKTRACVVTAAKQLYRSEPMLVRNDTETARRILEMRLPALRRGNNQQMSVDAVTRHLRAARRELCATEN
jgi:hypothetical protein